MSDETRMVVATPVSADLLVSFEDDDAKNMMISRNDAQRARLYNRTMEQNETLIKCSGVTDEMQSEALERITTSRSRHEILDTVQATLNNDTELLEAQRDASDVSEDEDEGDVMFYIAEHEGDCTTLIVAEETVHQTTVEPRENFMSTIDLDQEPGENGITDVYDVVEEFRERRLDADVYAMVLDDYNKMAALEFWCNHKDDKDEMTSAVGVADCDEMRFMDLWKDKVALTLDEFLEFMEDDENQDDDAYTWLETAIFKAKKYTRVVNDEYKHPPESAFIQHNTTNTNNKCMKEIIKECMSKLPKPAEFTIYMDKTMRIRSTRDNYKRCELGTISGLTTIDKAVSRLRSPRLKVNHGDLARSILAYCDSLAEQLLVYKENQ